MKVLGLKVEIGDGQIATFQDGQLTVAGIAPDQIFNVLGFIEKLATGTTSESSNAPVEDEAPPSSRRQSTEPVSERRPVRRRRVRVVEDAPPAASQSAPSAPVPPPVEPPVPAPAKDPEVEPGAPEVRAVAGVDFANGPDRTAWIPVTALVPAPASGPASLTAETPIDAPAFAPVNAPVKQDAPEDEEKKEPTASAFVWEPSAHPYQSINRLMREFLQQNPEAGPAQVNEIVDVVFDDFCLIPSMVERLEGYDNSAKKAAIRKQINAHFDVLKTRGSGR